MLKDVGQGIAFKGFRFRVCCEGGVQVYIVGLMIKQKGFGVHDMINMSGLQGNNTRFNFRA